MDIMEAMLKGIARYYCQESDEWKSVEQSRARSSELPANFKIEKVGSGKKQRNDSKNNKIEV